MTPKHFPEVNVIYAKDQPEYNPLPVYKDDKGTIVSCWELSDEEIEQIKTNKYLWLSVMTFNQPLQPLFLTTNKEDILNPIELEECIGCSEKFNYEIMEQDNSNENYCPECAKEMFPVMKAEYEEMVRNGEIEEE